MAMVVAMEAHGEVSVVGAATAVATAGREGDQLSEETPPAGGSLSC